MALKLESAAFRLVLGRLQELCRAAHGALCAEDIGDVNVPQAAQLVQQVSTVLDVLALLEIGEPSPQGGGADSRQTETAAKALEALAKRMAVVEEAVRVIAEAVQATQRQPQQQWNRDRRPAPGASLPRGFKDVPRGAAGRKEDQDVDWMDEVSPEDHRDPLAEAMEQLQPEVDDDVGGEVPEE